MQGKVTGAVFVGEGRLLLTPPIPAEMRSLMLLTREAEFSESFNRMVLRFTDDTYDELKKSGKPGSSAACDAGLLSDTQHTMRKKLHYNLDARILQDVLSPAPGGFFVAFIHGKHYSDKTLFVIDPHGVPNIYPEEIELRTYEDNKEGIWAAFHYSSEYTNGKATSGQKNNVVHIEHQQLDTEIEKSGHLDGKAVTSFVAKTAGVRVVPFTLFPTLRVHGVTGADGQPLNFIQEDKLDDPQFWVVLSKPLAEGETATITTVYDGKDAVSNQGGGNYFPLSREDWFPYAVAGRFRRVHELRHDLPHSKEMKMAVDRQPGKRHQPGGQERYRLEERCIRWRSRALTSAASRWIEAKIEKPDMNVLSYANEDPPAWVQSLQSSIDTNDQTGLHGVQGGGNEARQEIGGTLGTMSTVDLSKKALSEAELSMEIYSDFFGPIPLKRLEITQQTATDFGQSWPGLVYLPMTYLFDTTTRHALGNIMRRYYPAYADDPFGYYMVVAPHEVAHQWWGHAVGFNSYRDQWMSEGFADFSASLYLQFVYAKQPLRYRSSGTTSAAC